MLTLTLHLKIWLPEHTIRQAERQPGCPREDLKRFSIGGFSENGCEDRDKNEGPVDNVFKKSVENPKSPL